MTKSHSFHIPVMGIGFTIDTPIKVAPLGIDSVIFISDDILLEKMRKTYSEKYDVPYHVISDKEDDYRALRVTAYLNLVQDIVQNQFSKLSNYKSNKLSEIEDLLGLLPNGQELKGELHHMIANESALDLINEWLIKNISPGSIDVNIMTKLDRANYKNKEQLSTEFNDAHAALRGFAQSKLNSSVVFSAGMNPKLYSYAEQFEDFYPDKNGILNKKIILKVSDYRSALIQGKFLAKKGLWVSEYRIESGLNCGGHAFASDGYLMGPILDEFNQKRTELIDSVHQILSAALDAKNKPVPSKPLYLKVTAQGGVGTAEEHAFLLNHYNVDSVGWGTPFLLVPEATSVDEATINKLLKAKEKDLYLSEISPLGVPFNNLRGNTKDLEKLNFIAKGRPGSACPKKYLALSNEFEGEPICKASRQYQHLKLKELDSLDLTVAEHKKRFKKIVEPSCLCVGLGTSALIVNDVERKVEGDAVLICPGPNMAYFSKKSTLHEMTDHIYRRGNVISRSDRPNMFIKELSLYVEYLNTKMTEAGSELSKKEEKYFQKFASNLEDGIAYYERLFSCREDLNQEEKSTIYTQLESAKIAIQELTMTEA